MPDEKTHADSIRMYLTGAASDGAAQADSDLSLGKYRSSSEVTHLGATVTNPIANVTVAFASGSNGPGAGTLTASGVNELKWTPPGGTIGAGVTIANGETKILEGGGGETWKFIRVSRTSVDDLAGTATVTLAETFNNVIGFDNVSSAEQAAGDVEYRCFCLKNESASEAKNIVAWIGQLGTQRVSGTAQLGAAGAGTITIAAGDFSDWPSSGFCRIETSAGVLREIVYYSSRTSTSLTVPAAGREQLGTSAAAGAATDKIYAIPGIRIGLDAPDAQPDGTFVDNTGAGEGAAPGGVTFSSAITQATGIAVGDLAAGYIYGIWIERTVVAGATAEAANLKKIELGFDAA